MRRLTRKYIRKKCRPSRKARQIIILPPRPPPFRVAILYCGRIKGYTNVEQVLLNLQRKYNATVFCSLNKKTKSDYIKTFCEKFGISDERLNLEPTKTQEHIYAGITLCDLNMTLFDKERTYSQYFHKYRCFRLLEAYQQKYGIKFNCVILFRADVNSQEEFVIKRPEEETLYIPEGKDYYGLNDQIAYGNYESMKKYCDGVNSVKTVCDQLGLLNFPYSINENIMKRHVENTRCRIQRFPYSYELHPSKSEPLPEYDDFE